MELKYNYNLFLDDIRIPSDCSTYINDKRYTELEWDIVRSYDEFTKHIEDMYNEGSFPSLVSFDHDLDHEHYDPSMFVSSEAYENAYRAFTIPTGRKAAEYLVNFCREKQIAIPECLVHTMNPAGEIRILNTLNRIND
jgi:hypothetical protein